MPRIAVVGSCNVDLMTFTERFPRAGETLFGTGFDLGFGGKGANQAFAARRCGAEVAMIGCVGDDLFGQATARNFELAGIDTSHVRVVEGVPTGVAPIFVDATGQNRIVVVKGANDLLAPSDVDAAGPALALADCVVLQFEVPLETVIHTVEIARQRGIRTIVNPAPAMKIDLRKLAGIDYFVPNETEAEALTGFELRTEADLSTCARVLLDQGFRRVILTLGARGALLAGGDAMDLVQGFRVDTRDTTGAGDAFIGSFATFLAEGVGERDAIRRANLYAALSTTRIGTQKSFVTREEFEAEWRVRGVRL
jgi:ribokinase